MATKSKGVVPLAILQRRLVKLARIVKERGGKVPGKAPVQINVNAGPGSKRKKGGRK